MVNVTLEICKKELKTRFRTKAMILPLFMAVVIPLVSIVPQLHASVAQGDLASTYPLLVMLLMIPAIITSMIGMHAFTNELRWRTIKPLLASPVSIEEIFIGKSLACIITGLLVDGFLAIVLLISLPVVNVPIVIILLVQGPLLVIYATFLIIAATAKFPSAVEGGIAVYLPMGGIMGVLLVSFILQMVFPASPILNNVLITLVIAMLSLLTFFTSTKWFSRERLVVG